MRDAFGGAFSIKLMMIFLVLYVCFICVALNYSRAFRVKNRIINIIEQYEGFDFTNEKNDVNKAIDDYLATTGYLINPEIKQYLAEEGASSCNQLYGRGYCVYKTYPNQNYYEVETYMVFTLPIVNVKFPVTIKGETRIIEVPKKTS